MDEIVADYTYTKARLKVILNNLNTHKKSDEWLKRHPLVTLHFTPTRASCSIRSSAGSQSCRAGRFLAHCGI
jgi:hypothetical protein